MGCEVEEVGFVLGAFVDRQKSCPKSKTNYSGLPEV